MQIYIFKSEASRDLRAFCDDRGGQKLPAQFRPWHAVGVVREDAPPPNNLSRDVIEASIASDGYQLWKLKARQEAVSDGQPSLQTRRRRRTNLATAAAGHGVPGVRDAEGNSRTKARRL